MVETFKNNGIDIEKYSYDYGLKATRPGEGYIFSIEKEVYQHEIIGDRDNGRINKVYNTEDEMVEDMIRSIKRKAIINKIPYRKVRKAHSFRCGMDSTFIL